MHQLVKLRYLTHPRLPLPLVFPLGTSQSLVSYDIIFPHGIQTSARDKDFDLCVCEAVPFRIDNSETRTGKYLTPFRERTTLFPLFRDIYQTCLPASFVESVRYVCRFLSFSSSVRGETCRLCPSFLEEPSQPFCRFFHSVYLRDISPRRGTPVTLRPYNFISTRVLPRTYARESVFLPTLTGSTLRPV